MFLRPSRSVSLALGVAAFGVIPRDARACDPVRVCFDFQVHTTDSRCLSDGSPVCACSDPNIPCEDLPVGVQRSGPGMVEIVPASFVKGRLVRLPPESILDFVLDENGCLEFHSQHRTGFSFRLESEALVRHASRPDPIRLTFSLNPFPPNDLDARDTRSVANCVGKSTDVTSVSAHWPATVTSEDLKRVPSGGAVRIGIDVTSAKEEVFPIALHALRRYDSLAPLPTGNQIIVKANCFVGPGKTTFGSEHEVMIQVPPDEIDPMTKEQGTANRKFVIAHEVGHAFHAAHARVPPKASVGVERSKLLQAPVTGEKGEGIDSYKLRPNDVNCGLNDFRDIPGVEAEFHHLRSVEMAPDGITEGMAHFFATLAYNHVAPQAHFQYYKHIGSDPEYGYVNAGPYTQFVANHHRVALQVPARGAVGGDAEPTALGQVGALGGPREWLRRSCPSDYMEAQRVSLPERWSDDFEQQGEYTEYEVELDVMRFFWAMIADTSAPGPVPSVADLMKIIRFMGTFEREVIRSGMQPMPEKVFGWTSRQFFRGLCLAFIDDDPSWDGTFEGLNIKQFHARFRALDEAYSVSHLDWETCDALPFSN